MGILTIETEKLGWRGNFKLFVIIVLHWFACVYLVLVCVSVAGRG